MILLMAIEKSILSNTIHKMEFETRSRNLI